MIQWRKERDSNPRSLAAQRFSRPPQSTTLPSFRVQKYNHISTYPKPDRPKLQRPRNNQLTDMHGIGLRNPPKTQPSASYRQSATAYTNRNADGISVFQKKSFISYTFNYLPHRTPEAVINAPKHEQETTRRGHSARNRSLENRSSEKPRRFHRHSIENAVRRRPNRHIRIRHILGREKERTHGTRPTKRLADQNRGTQRRKVPSRRGTERTHQIKPTFTTYTCPYVKTIYLIPAPDMIFRPYLVYLRTSKRQAV